ncbi:MAG TPA: phosphotransferase family protein [Streptosporangiaceae bacterium]
MPSIPPGIASVPRLESWLADNVADIPDRPVTVASVQLITGGRSNLTYRLVISGSHGERVLVLRRPPLGHVLPTAHDMSREYHVLSGLAGTRVPVARPLAICTDTEIIGAPFYVMDFVSGQVLRTREDAAVLTPAQAKQLSEGLAGMLATIHGVDLAATGLTDLGRGTGYLRRQLDRWQRQWQLSATREVPGYEELVARLTARLPEEGDITLVHGDFRIDNVLVALSPQPRVAAVVDWEMATLGDPLADLGLTLVYWTEAGEEGWLNPSPAPGEASAAVPGEASAAPGEASAARSAAVGGVSTDATVVPGFYTRAEFAADYASRTGRDIAQIEYYVAFGYFKLAVVLEGINARYLKRQTVGEGFDREGKAVPLLIARAHQVLDSLR